MVLRDMILRPFLETAAAVFLLLSVLMLGILALPTAVEATGRSALFGLYFGGYAAHFLLFWPESTRGRWAFDVWLATGWLALLVVKGFMERNWPIETDPNTWQDWFGGGAANIVLLPFLHAALWWGVCFAVRRGRED